MKRVLCSVLVLLLLAGTLAGCGGKSEDVDLSEKSSVTFYFPGEARKDAEMIVEEIEKRTADTINADITFNWVPFGDYTNKINVMLAGGDTYEGHGDAEWRNFPRFASNGSLMDITDLLPQYAPDVYKSLSKEALAAASFKGRVYAVPVNTEGTSRRVARIREDLRIKYNVPEIKTFDDLEVYLDAIKQNEPNMVPLICSTSDLTCVLFSEECGYASLGSSQMVVKIDDPELKVIPWEQTPEYHDIVERMIEWYNKGYFPKDVLSYKGKGLEGGAVAATIHTFGQAPSTTEQLRRIDPSYECREFGLYPDKPALKASPMQNGMVINANAANPEKALMLINWIRSNQENYDLFNYGIEGLHYTIEGNKVILPEGTDMSNHPYIGTTGLYNLEESKYNRVSTGYPDNWKEITSEFSNNNTVYSPILGFNPDYENVKTELAERTNNISNMGVQLERGLLPSSDIDKYIQLQKDAGSDVLAAELQRQIDEWAKTR